jgi:hypothetical protein
VRDGDIIWDEKINKREQNERKKTVVSGGYSFGRARRGDRGDKRAGE